MATLLDRLAFLQKVLKILRHLCDQGSSQFVLELRRNATFIQEVAAFSGPPDPVHGNALFQMVRAAAQELASMLFTNVLLPLADTPSSEMLPQTGETVLTTIQKAAEVVASAILSPLPESVNKQRSCLQDDTYQPVTAPSAVVEVTDTDKPCPAVARVRRYLPGHPGGGWEESDSGHSSQDSSQENYGISRISDACSKCGSDSHSGASRESGDLIERVEGMSLGDCTQEVLLINSLTQVSRVFLTREENQNFLKECALLNCDVVLDLVNRRLLEDPSEAAKMRMMSAISSLICSDLLSHEQIFTVTQPHLQLLSNSTPGPIANRATKLLRQLLALTRRDMSSKEPHAKVVPSESPVVPQIANRAIVSSDPTTREYMIPIVTSASEPLKIQKARETTINALTLPVSFTSDEKVMTEAHSNQQTDKTKEGVPNATLPLTGKAEGRDLLLTESAEDKQTRQRHKLCICDYEVSGHRASLFDGMEFILRERTYVAACSPTEVSTPERTSRSAERLHHQTAVASEELHTSTTESSSGSELNSCSAFSFLNV
ncbi:AP-4 complex accessory subunit tepsin isoform X2 [Protopterus annectens]|uniref:AP-4 complex accessory subunit tepsin isoform X2 n=1 Tax=Protopterus annectens TaxID=7888 RepID=UPI001CFB2130|nr:AP-4 complex accessory subunit tepsin isoform X2 [Protopterus annectens]